MFNYSIPENKQYITIWGTYESLKMLNEVIHNLNERFPLFSDKEGMLLGLCYELRKAYENQRQSDEEMGAVDYEPNTGIQAPHYYHVYGAEVNPLNLIMSVAYLQQVHEYPNITKSEKGYLYLLEDVTEHAFKAYRPKPANSLFETAKEIAAKTPYSFADEELSVLYKPFYELTPSKRSKYIEEYLRQIAEA